MDTPSWRLRACGRTGTGTPGESARLGRLNRAPRAAATALLLAAAIGAAGTTGISSVLAVDPPSSVLLSGTVVDDHGAALGGVGLVISEEQPPDGGLAGFEVSTGPDGSFEVALHPWGTADAPARLTIATAQDEEIQVIAGSCTQTWGVAVADERDLALDGVTEPLPAARLVATTTLRGKVCATVGTPRPESHSGSGSGAAAVTPPPTDARPVLSRAGREDRLASALALGFVIGLLAVVALGLRTSVGRR